MSEKPTRWQRVRKLWPDVLIVLVVISGVYLYRMQDMLNADYQPAPALSLAALDGEVTMLADDRPALVYFFAPWCNICGASAHNLRNLRRLRAEDDLQILLVALDWEDVSEVRAFVDRHELTADVLLGLPQTARDWGVSVFPTYYVLDDENRIAHRDFGYSTLLGLWVRTVLA
jgi:peroxiredoxin